LNIKKKGLLLMTKPRILYMGTPAFALPALTELHRQNYPLLGVVTQPDRPAGRGQKEIAPPVKILAQKLGLPVFQPDKVRVASFLKIYQELNPEMVVVAAFGQILPKAILDLPKFKCLNIHPSLLPKYRGAAPINWAIIRGEKKTGVTIMLMDEGMDSGDILLQRETDIGSTENYGQLHDRLALMGTDLLIEAIDKMAAGKALPRQQDASLTTFAPRLKKETGEIDWKADVSKIVNLIRGLSPIPAAYTFLAGQQLKIYEAGATQIQVTDAPGTIGEVNTDGLPVAAGNGYVLLKEVQLAGKKRMAIRDFLRGFRLDPKIILS
jgi:methionyl-tRNA formyltransferase